jgi:hypothetical protein
LIVSNRRSAKLYYLDRRPGNRRSITRENDPSRDAAAVLCER